MEELKGPQRSWLHAAVLTAGIMLLWYGWLLAGVIWYAGHGLVGPDFVSEYAEYWPWHTAASVLLTSSIVFHLWRRRAVAGLTRREKQEVDASVEEERKKIEVEIERDEENLRKNWKWKIIAILLGVALFAAAVRMG